MLILYPVQKKGWLKKQSQFARLANQCKLLFEGILWQNNAYRAPKNKANLTVHSW
jgi:hypothetical protein